MMVTIGARRTRSSSLSTRSDAARRRSSASAWRRISSSTSASSATVSASSSSMTELILIVFGAPRSSSWNVSLPIFQPIASDKARTVMGDEMGTLPTRGIVPATDLAMGVSLAPTRPAILIVQQIDAPILSDDHGHAFLAFLGALLAFFVPIGSPRDAAPAGGGARLALLAIEVIIRDVDFFGLNGGSGCAGRCSNDAVDLRFRFGAADEAHFFIGESLFRSDHLFAGPFARLLLAQGGGDIRAGSGAER